MTEIEKKFGDWTGQVRAVSIAHYVFAALHFCLVFYVNWIWEYSKKASVQYMTTLFTDPEAEALAWESFEQMAWVPWLLIAVVVVFSFLFALNGWLLWHGRGFARTNAIVLGVLLLFSFPIGTPFGIWFIYVMTQRDVATAFRNLDYERKMQPGTSRY